MNKYEKLQAEYDNLYIEERPMKSDGLYADGHIWINDGLLTVQKACILAEEIGHYETSSGDILDQEDANNRKQEYAARRWAYEKLVPIENIHFAVADGHTEIWDMAEYLEVDEAFLREALKFYGYLSA